MPTPKTANGLHFVWRGYILVWETQVPPPKPMPGYVPVGEVWSLKIALYNANLINYVIMQKPGTIQFLQTDV